MLVRLLWLTLRSRTRSGATLWDVVRTPFRVVPTDLDVQRHMNNGKYLSILDLGRLDLLRRSGFWQVMRARGWYPVVAAQTITYRKSLVLWQRFEVETRLLGLDDRAFYLEQSFLVGEQIVARAVVCGRMLRRTGGTVDQAELLAAIGPHSQTRALPDWVARWAADSRLSRSG